MKERHVCMFAFGVGDFGVKLRQTAGQISADFGKGFSL